MPSLSTVSAALSTVIDRVALTRILVGWAAVAIFLLWSPAGGSSATVWAILAVVVAVIVFSAFGVVHQAGKLADRLGDPYGSLVLTLSIVIIEVILISAVMLGPGEHATIARDSVMAVSMVIMNLVAGVALLVGALRHDTLRVNTSGASAYMAMLITLVSIGLVLPGLVGIDGAYTPVQQIVVIALTIAIYSFFLLRQTTSDSADYQDGSGSPEHYHSAGAPELQPPIANVFREHGKEVALRAVVLVITVLPIVILAEVMATLLDDALASIGAPVALAGLIIATIVFTPEALTSIRAGAAGEAQRVINLCHGALVSTVGLTIPAVLTIGALTNQVVVLAVSPANMLLLLVTVLLAINMISARRITPSHGAAHVAVFVVYVMTIFS